MALGTGRAAGGGTGGPGPGSPTRAPCPSEAGEEQRGGGGGQGDTCEVAGRELTGTWVCSCCRAATSLPGTRLPSPALCPSLLRSSSSPERGVPPVSPRLASPPPCGGPRWPRHRVWHRGCLLPPLTASWGWLGAGCPCSSWWGQVLAVTPLSRWARGCPGHWLAGTPGLCAKHFVRQRSFSAGACELPRGSCPVPASHQHARVSTQLVLGGIYLFPWC